MKHKAALAAALVFALSIVVGHAINDPIVGYVYTINNDSQRNGIAVLERRADGTIKEMEGSPFSTGGRGISGGDIDEQGAIRVYRNYILAVNPGSDSVGVLLKGDDGKLTPVQGSPFPSGGSAPLSLTIQGDLVYVRIKHRRSRTPGARPTSWDSE